MELFGSNGVRGVVGEELTPDLAGDVAQAAAAELGADRVAVGRDTRPSGEMLAAAAASGVAAAGADVERLGVVPTPCAQSHAARRGIPAVVVTASHNPREYNGLKLYGADGADLSVAELEAVEERVGSEPCADWESAGGVTEVDGARRRYVEELLAAVDREAIADADLTVALDPGNGAGAHTSPEFLRRLGCRVLTVNAQPDGRFPGRASEPVPENLGSLSRLVATTEADLGIAHDGDADRATFVDETGAHVDGDAALAALADASLEAGDVFVGAAAVSQRLVDVVDDAGAALELAPVGTTYIAARVRELRDAGERVPVAGEGNGGVLFPETLGRRDGAYTAGRFLELVADRPASEVVAPYEGYHYVRENLDYRTEEERASMLAAAERFASESDAELSTVDGYRLDYGDAWLLIRPSGTEPVVRVYVEARDRDRATALVEEAADALGAAR